LFSASYAFNAIDCLIRSKVELI